MATFRICGVQMAVSDKLDDNLSRILETIQSHDCDYMLFPEMCLTGNHGGFSDKAARGAWNAIAEACRQACVCAIFGTGRIRDDRRHNQARIYDDNGELVGTHEKLVPTLHDRKWCEPGEKLRTFEHRGINFGVLIGNDLWVTPGLGPYPDPRLSLQLGERGVQVIFHLADTGVDDGTHHLFRYHTSNLALRAMESKAHIVTANTTYRGGLNNSPSGVMDPTGEWLTELPREGEGVYSIDLNLDTI